MRVQVASLSTHLQKPQNIPEMILDARVQHLSRITFYFYFSNDFYIIIRLILFIFFVASCPITFPDAITPSTGPSSSTGNRYIILRNCPVYVYIRQKTLAGLGVLVQFYFSTRSLFSFYFFL